MLGKLGKRLSGLAYWALGGPHLRWKAGRARLDLAAFAKGRGLFAAWSWVAFSAAGLTLGNLPRLLNIAPALGWGAATAACVLVGLAAAAACGLLGKKRSLKAEPPPAAAWGKAAGPLALGLLALPAAAGLGILGAGLFWHALGGLCLEAARGEVRAAGFSVGLPPKGPGIPDADNAAKAFVKAAEHPSLTDAPKGPNLTLFAKQAIAGKASARDYAAARKALAAKRPALALARRAAAMKGVDWGVDWSRWPPIEIETPRYGHLTSLATSLQASALVSARAGRATEAVEAVRDLLALARAVNSGELLIGTMVATSFSRRALDVARLVLPAAPELARRRWGPLLDPAAFRAAARRSLEIEFFGFHDWIGQLGWREAVRQNRGEAGFADVGTSDWSGFMAAYWPYLGFDLASGYRGFLESMTAMDLPYPRSRRALEEAGERFRRRGWFLGQISFSSHDRIHRRILLAETDLRLARAALEARRWRRAKGAWPKAASEPDPFAEGPLKLARKGRGVLLYSVGPDDRDEGGSPFDPDAETGDPSWPADGVRR